MATKTARKTRTTTSRTSAKAAARTTTKRSSAKRDLVQREGAGAYAKRTASGRFKEMDDIGRSQRADRTRKAKTTVRSGYGDQGDQNTSAKSAKRTRR